MNSIKIAAFLLILAGALGLWYGTFTYTKALQEAKIGSLAITITEKKSVNIPVYLGVGAIVIGGGMLLFNKKLQT